MPVKQGENEISFVASKKESTVIIQEEESKSTEGAELAKVNGGDLSPPETKNLYNE